MSSTASCRAVLQLSIIFVSVLVSQGGILDFGQHKHEGDNVYDGYRPLQQDQAVLEFPALDEMTSDERAANRQRARKVATIIEKSFHMLANDILQMWAIARTEKSDGGEAKDEFDDVEESPLEGKTERTDEAGEGVSEEAEDVTNITKTEKTGGVKAEKTEGETSEGLTAKITEEAGTEETRETTGTPGSQLTEKATAESTKKPGVEKKTADEETDTLPSSGANAIEQVAQAVVSNALKTLQTTDINKVKLKLEETGTGTYVKSKGVVDVLTV